MGLMSLDLIEQIIPESSDTMRKRKKRNSRMRRSARSARADFAALPLEHKFVNGKKYSNHFRSIGKCFYLDYFLMTPRRMIRVRNSLMALTFWSSDLTALPEIPVPEAVDLATAEPALFAVDGDDCRGHRQRTMRKCVGAAAPTPPQVENHWIDFCRAAQYKTWLWTHLRSM
ncbi:hypothetical protein TCAL_17153 [Tigriopus californicus]|uniref:Uncharacterized protein n=1 Tax=Tigriopus californicus TaxID=6832 RepID=A0A553P4L8_TIGCA|nr:hypothetical protein TCAL_17153 [Tigriopus californicus]